jgi:hypothetical protein
MKRFDRTDCILPEHAIWRRTGVAIQEIMPNSMRVGPRRSTYL